MMVVCQVKDDVPSTSAPESNPFTANSTSEGQN